jgi:hypothetical protein
MDKCTRCGRMLRNPPIVVEGAAFGPVCARKLGFVASAVPREKKLKSLLELVEDASQLSFFPDEQEDLK